jgi:hypothetical protein
MEGLWHRIVPAGVQGMAAQDPPDGQPAALEGTKTGDRLHGVFRAGGMKTTARPKQWTDPALVAAEHGNEKAVDHDSLMRSST